MSDDESSPAPVVYRPELALLLNDVSKPLPERFRALFTLKNIGGPESIDAISQCFGDASALLKHECAYCLGQLQDARAVPVLSAVLRDEHQDTMVRHEAGEALGAIGGDDSKAVLEEYVHSPIPEIAETCQIALDRIAWVATQEKVQDNNPYASVDPAPPTKKKSVPTPQLRAQLLDASLPLFERYRALFSLRNRGDSESVEAIVAGLQDKSALFRHEMAYVLGQMQHPHSVEGLKRNLEDIDENYMVRHECAEALGAIAVDECLPVLKKYATDEAQVVKESCLVALDMHEYENSNQFQYADGLQRVETE